MIDPGTLLMLIKVIPEAASGVMKFIGLAKGKGEISEADFNEIKDAAEGSDASWDAAVEAARQREAGNSE